MLPCPEVLTGAQISHYLNNLNVYDSLKVNAWVIGGCCVNVTVIGGGNIGTLLAAEFAAKGHAVTMMTSNASIWHGHVEAYGANDVLLCEGDLACVTSSLDEAVQEADMIWVTYPTFMLEAFAARVLPLLKPNQALGVVPGNDAEFIFGSHVANGGILFGLQRTHSVARLREPGRSVYSLGRRTSGLHVAALPAAKTSEIARVVRDLFDLPVEELPTFLVETLTPSNPILHTTRIYTMFRAWRPGVYYDRNILFYEEWDLLSAECLLTCDAELQRVCRALEFELGVDLGGVRSLKDHYESYDAQALVDKITSISGFKGLTSPMKEVSPGKWVPDFESRYFKADFSYGMKAIKDIARLVDVPIPAIDEIYGWYREISGDTAEFKAVPDTLEDLAALYI